MQATPAAFVSAAAFDERCVTVTHALREDIKTNKATSHELANAVDVARLFVSARGGRALHHDESAVVVEMDKTLSAVSEVCAENIGTMCPPTPRPHAFRANSWRLRSTSPQ